MTSSDDKQCEPFLNPPQGAAEKVRAVVEPAIEALGAELVLLQYVRGPKQTVLRLFCDEAGEGTIGLDKLTALNRTLGHLLEVEDEHQKLFGATWNLEVSSPGVDRPLAKRSHFARAVGERVKVKLRATRNGKRTFIGKLDAATDEGITLATGDDETDTLPWDEIDDAHVVFEFGPAQTKRAKAKKKGKGSKGKAPDAPGAQGQPDTGAQ